LDLFYTDPIDKFVMQKNGQW